MAGSCPPVFDRAIGPAASASRSNCAVLRGETTFPQVARPEGLEPSAGAQVNVGFELAGQRVTLRMDGTQMAVISHDGALLLRQL